MAPLLEVHNVVKRYGPKTVVDCVSLSVKEGELIGVIGPNGAGKTTLFNLIDGATRCEGGSVKLGGAEITRLAPFRRARMGIGRAYQVPRPFSGLSVFENTLVGAFNVPGASTKMARRRALDVLEEVGLADKREVAAGALALLDRKRLELAKAMSVGAKALLLDEIAGGLTDHEVFVLVDIVKRLKPGRAILWIEHIAHALKEAADRILVLNFGAKLIEDTPAVVMADPQVQEIYLGISVDDAAGA
jgi:branched-chain amino acid transport system ATP-binding protein